MKLVCFTIFSSHRPQRRVPISPPYMTEDPSSTRGFEPEPLDPAHFLDFDPPNNGQDVQDTSGVDGMTGLENSSWKSNS
jgi:hypothetical protein